MKHIPIRLGPLALLLAVISICMTTLGILTFSTARADLRLAEKYADTVRSRYALETEGQAFLEEADALAAGEALDELEGVEADEGGIFRKTFEREDLKLEIGIVPDRSGGCRVVSWRFRKEWEPEEGLDIWLGE